MKLKARILIAGIIGLIAGLAIGFYCCFPWDSIAENAFSKAVIRVSEKGIYLTKSSTDTSGIVDKTFTYNGVTAELPFAKLKINNLSVTPKTFSFMSDSKEAHVTLRNVILVAITRHEFSLRSARADVTYNENNVKLENIAVSGDISVRGSAEIDMTEKKLVKAALIVNAPPVFDRVMNMARLARIAPMQKIKDGEWRITK